MDVAAEEILDGRYRLHRVLGKGAWAIVYLADQESVAREVAIKVLQPEACKSPEVVTRTLREAHLVASLNHPNIVTVHDFGRVDNRPFIVMEWVRGPSLARRIRGRRRLHPEEALTVFAQMARGLACAHRRGIVHRDIKPANILLDYKANGEVVAKVTDFGVATTVASDLTMAGAVIGTPAYMAPEQARGEAVDARADLYGLGAVMFRVLTGRRPYEAPDALAMAVCHLTLPLPTFAEVDADLDIDPRLEEIVRRCLEKDPADRYPSAEALLLDLESPDGDLYAPEAPDETLETSPPAPARERRPRIGLFASALAVLAIVLVAVGALSGLRSPTVVTPPAAAPMIPPPAVIAPVVATVAAPVAPIGPPAPTEDELAAEEVEEPPPPVVQGFPIDTAGDARRVWLVDASGHRAVLPATLAAGEYEIVALFPSAEPTQAGVVTIDGPTTLRCLSFAMRCKPR